MKTLMVFDFDHTVVDDNSDTWVIRCLPSRTLPDSVRRLYRRGHWTDFMCKVMAYIGEQEVGPDGVRGVMEAIPLTAGMVELLSFIAEHKSSIDCIVISDSNAIFIDWILQRSGLRAAVDQVFTNPAKFNERGHMEVASHHAHSCSRCPANLCKRAVLERYLSEQSGTGVAYERVFYVGDGGNDLCPTACLRRHDVAMPRKGYALEKLLARLQSRGGAASLRADVVSWSSGVDILKELQASLWR
ncbi:pyridoxal phosphate phosphatase PHOSPHO2 [Brachionichthys hirsutus]|uniref:pyridoxal phosphate phosphatase PHOSPHO2 n=1 Tax=Brachionichthys hirsutus TaxID=412623 RepID=UPI00360445DE